jgi:hypothetical protein
LCLTKNKVSFYNSRLKLESGETNAMASSIKELTEVIDSITTQVNFKFMK